MTREGALDEEVLFMGLVPVDFTKRVEGDPMGWDSHFYDRHQASDGGRLRRREVKGFCMLNKE